MPGDQARGYRDLKFGNLVIDESYKGLPSHAKCESLRSVIDAYVANLDRVGYAIQLPGFVAYYTGTFLGASMTFMKKEKVPFADLSIDNPDEDKTWVKFRSFYIQLTKALGLTWFKSWDRSSDAAQLFIQ